MDPPTAQTNKKAASGGPLPRKEGKMGTRASAQAPKLSRSGPKPSQGNGPREASGRDTVKGSSASELPSEGECEAILTVAALAVAGVRRYLFCRGNKKGGSQALPQNCLQKPPRRPRSHGPGRTSSKTKSDLAVFHLVLIKGVDTHCTSIRRADFLLMICALGT